MAFRLESVPDNKWGEAVMAFVILTPNSATNQTAIIEHCRSLIANYKCPKSVSIVPDFPKNASGKVLKRLLREPFWREYERAVN